MFVWLHEQLNDASSKFYNHIGGVMVSVLDYGFKPRTGQTNDYEIGICCFSAKHNSIKEKEQRMVGSES